MKHIIIITAIVLSAISVFAQERTEKRVTNDFTQISLRIYADLYYVEGEEHSIEISGESRTIDKVIVEVTGQKLIVRFSLEDQFFRNFGYEKLKIKVVSPSVKAFYIQGGGNIISENPIETHHLDINIAGSGNVKINKVNSDRIECTISGSGDVVVTDKSECKDLFVNIAGSGNFKNPHLQTNNAYILIAGSGNCELSAIDYLDAKIFGSGDIGYKGEPQIKTTVTGSGRVKHIN